MKSYKKLTCPTLHTLHIRFKDKFVYFCKKISLENGERRC